MGKLLHDIAIAVGTAVTGFFLTVPEAALQAWQSSPELVKAVVPEELVPLVSGTLTFLVVISRFIKSRKDKK